MKTSTNNLTDLQTAWLVAEILKLEDYSIKKHALTGDVKVIIFDLEFAEYVGFDPFTFQIMGELMVKMNMEISRTEPHLSSHLRDEVIAYCYMEGYCIKSKEKGLIRAVIQCAIKATYGDEAELPTTLL